ncbi:UDP-2,4-diacetamido-2,4,6-trideoxy-beta-L-altropyranose hydrolase [Cellulophaga baltica]|uniref:UDP-2,4-diacetamido-2,4, 6-trideoxy-beta-L-altropyranose hydrolase n=1 Tax=Cellulophaga baltica TaxID=76594 RepID=UPI002493F27C|nr:UDP-2,4-diacetamido-2,4,6-trideoxy-beta-L-altropyranose hydrolase [Cellulophaga baltica]
MSKKIIFRADGDSTTGLGHLYRLFSLVEIIKHTYQFVFVVLENSTNSIIPKEYNKVIIPKEIKTKNEPEWLESNFPSKDYILIADGYQFTASYQKKIKQKGYNLIYIDDLVTEHMYADIVINHSPYLQKDNYQKENYTELALGTQFALLRPLFLEEAKKIKTINTINTAFICFGGADPFNLSLKALNALLQVKSFKKIHVVLGGAYKHEEIFNLKENNPSKIQVHRNISEKNLINVMSECQFAIAPASTILYELCCLKMPILSGYYVENQKNIYNGLSQKNAIINGGDFRNYKTLDFLRKIKDFLNNPKIDSYLISQQSLFDSNSKIRILGLINKLSISFRKAEEEDLLQVYNWSNDVLVRQNSYNSDSISIEKHKIWYLEKIKNKNTLFLIALINNKQAGIVRFEINKGYSIIGILVSKEFRGQKLASAFLNRSAEKYFENYDSPILAYIKKENIASIKSFEKARYTYFKDEIINGITSFVYKLEKHDVIR